MITFFKAYPIRTSRKKPPPIVAAGGPKLFTMLIILDAAPWFSNQHHAMTTLIPRKKVIKLMKDLSYQTEQMTGIQTSLQEQDIQQYLNKVIEEIKEKGRS